MGGAQPRRSRTVADGREEKTARGRAKTLRRRTPQAFPADELSQASEVLAGAGLPDSRWISSNELAISFL